MERSLEESLLQAIKNDDIKAFDALMATNQCGACRLGRFPTLSLTYLYKSRKILAKYEQSFLTITNFKVLSEPIEVSNKFSSKAGKCLRLYFNEVVSPLEMLLILDRTNHLKKVYPTTMPSPAVKGRLKSIYYIKYSLGVRFEGSEIIIDRRPLSYREKKRIATICLCVVLSLLIVVGGPVTVVSIMPKPIEGEVTKLKQIDFASDKEYTLKKDVVIPKNYSVEQVNCTIIGDGHKLIFGKGANLGELNGKLSGLTIESSGDPLFISVSEKATIEDVTLNVNADISTTEGTAFLALTNFGSIDGVTLNVSGKINALASSTQATDELTFGGIVQNNYYKYDIATQTVYRGVIKNCSVNYSQFSIVGQAGANAAFGAVAGINNGFLQDCKVTGEITADTFDLAGVCTTNNALLSGDVNEANLSQISADTGWNPITCGIVITNAYAVENCQNKGKISSVSSCPQFEIQEGTDPATAATGIAYLNRGTATTPYIVNSSNFGNVECQAQYRNAYAAGVCISSSGGMEGCKNNGDVTVKTANGMDAYVGGIATIVYGNISKSVNKGAITATGGEEAYIGGIAAQSCVTLNNCISSGDITATAKKVYAGGILGVSEVVRSGYYIYCGIADYCISQVKMNVSATDGAPVYVGGITGYVKEMGFENSDTMTYFGGCVTNCYFTGNIASEVSYFGNIVGVCGVNTYESNLYNTSNGVEYYNFDGNYYLGNSSKAFGATVTDDESFATVEDKGADSATSEFIMNTEIYKTILKNCGIS